MLEISIIPYDLLEWTSLVLIVFAIMCGLRSKYHCLTSWMFITGCQTALLSCVYVIAQSLLYMGLPGSWRAEPMWNSVISILLRSFVLSIVFLFINCRNKEVLKNVRHRWVIIPLSILLLDVFMLSGLAECVHEW